MIKVSSRLQDGRGRVTGRKEEGKLLEIIRHIMEVYAKSKTICILYLLGADVIIENVQMLWVVPLREIKMALTEEVTF